MKVQFSETLHRTGFYWNRLVHYWLRSFFPAGRSLLALRHLWPYLKSWRRYAAIEGAEPITFLNSYPTLDDAVAVTPFDAHYFYQTAWAVKQILRQGTGPHFDLGSDIQFVAALSASRLVFFLDYRPLRARLPGLMCLGGDLLNLPFGNGSIDSISCLHVAEHIGLGRYGDPLNPFGTRQACAELNRVLAPGGDLFFSIPIGIERVCFNAHRILTPRQVLALFSGLELVHFSGVHSDGVYQVDADPEQFGTETYALGLFHFRKSRLVGESYG